MDGIMRDPQDFPRYVMTGNDSAMMSNRISHFFDLRGPSMTINTGCSTGLTALHQACQSLRTRESDISIEEDSLLDSLAYTVGERRSRYPWSVGKLSGKRNVFCAQKNARQSRRERKNSERAPASISMLG